jgi:hypothetical protein
MGNFYFLNSNIIFIIDSVRVSFSDCNGIKKNCTLREKKENEQENNYIFQFLFPDFLKFKFAVVTITDVNCFIIIYFNKYLLRGHRKNNLLISTLNMSF